MLYRYLLFVRFALFNVVAIAALAAVYLQGWLDAVLDAHLVELSAVIFLVFLYGLGLCWVKVWHHSVELNDLKTEMPAPDSRAAEYLAQTEAAGPESRAIHVIALRLRLTNRIVVVRNIANSLVLLGLIGTVIGFIIALSGIDPAAATRVESVAAMISTLINGMSVALNTTLVGAVLYVWLIVNYGILTTGAVDLMTSIIDKGEDRAAGT